MKHLAEPNQLLNLRVHTENSHNIDDDIFYSQINETTMHSKPSMKNYFHSHIQSSKKSLRELKEERIKNSRVQLQKQKLGEVKEMMNKSKEYEPVDSQFIDFMGEEAVEQYYTHYRRLNKIKQENKLNTIQDSAFTTVLDSTERNRLIPSKLGVVKIKGDYNTLDINHQKYGNNYIDCLSKAVKLMPNLNNLNLKSNRITENGAEGLMRMLNTNIQVLNISDNNIGKMGVDNLSKFLIQRDCKITDLDISSNKLGDKSIQKLLQSIQTNFSIKILNISNNFISNSSAGDIAQLIESKYQITELYMNWNMIKSDGGAQIFKEMQENEAIKVLDIGWNSLGSGNDRCVEQLCEFMTKNKTVLHLDLSNNDFNLKQSIQISQSLEKNRTIYGFHFQGNYGYVDYLGFLIVDQHSQKDQVRELIPNNIKSVVKVSKRTKREIGGQVKNACWLCDGWIPQDFSWTYGRSGHFYRQPAFIMFDFMGWNGIYLGKINKKYKTYLYKIMVPPGSCNFFYSFNFVDCVSNRFDKVSSKIFRPIKSYYALQDNDVKLELINRVTNKRTVNLINPNSYEVQTDILPRQPENKYIIKKEKEQKKVWDLNKSIFRDYQTDTNDLLKKCFEFDFQCSRIPRLVKNEDDLNNTKQTLWKYYRIQKNAYKYFASLNPVGEIWSLQPFAYTMLIHQSNVIDSEHLRQQEVDLKFIATNANPDMKGPRNPERGMVRFQLMECLVRLAEEKYVKPKICQTYTEAVDKMIQDHFHDIFNKYEHQKFRDEKYWNEECERVILKYKVHLNNIYDKYSVKKVTPGQKKFMCLDELHEISKVSELSLDAHFQEQDIFVAFNLAMQTQVDEINSNRIFQMNHLEFYESLARIADKISLPQLGMHGMTYEQRLSQPLFIKLESLIVHILDKICDIHILEQHPLQKQKSIFDVELSDISSEEEEAEDQNLSPAKSANMSPIRTSIHLLTRKFNNNSVLESPTSAFNLQPLNQTVNN